MAVKVLGVFIVSIGFRRRVQTIGYLICPDGCIQNN